MDDISGAIAELVPLLQRFVTGRYALALGGSLAKAKGDSLSDLDLYLFADELASVEARRNLIVQKTGADAGIWVGAADLTGIGGSGTDFTYGRWRVETLARGIAVVEKVIGDCQAGRYEAWLSCWNPWGFYSHVLLSDIATAQPLADAQNILGVWQERLRVYPAPLKAAIMKRHLAAARFWPGNFHYATAVQRGDFLYTQGIAGQVTHHLLQVLYALNEKYYPGDKKNLLDVAKFALCPPGFAEELRTLLAPVVPRTAQEQQNRLRRMVEAVGALAETVGF